MEISKHERYITRKGVKMATTKIGEVTPELGALCQTIKTIDTPIKKNGKKTPKNEVIYFSKLRELVKHFIREQDLSNAMDILYDHEIITCTWERVEENEWRWVRSVKINDEAEHKSRRIYKEISSELPLK